MSKFNPEDFKAPEMEPLSNVTIDGYSVEWDKTADGLIGVFKGVAVRMEGERVFVRVGGDFTDMPAVETDLVMEDGNIMLGTAMIGVGKISDIDPEIFNKEMTGGFAEDEHEMEIKETRPSYEDLVKRNEPIIDSIKNTELLPSRHVSKISDLSGAKAQCGSRIQMNASKFTDPSGAKAECNPRTETVGRQPVYCRECSCKSCGAPVSFYRVDAKTFEEAVHKGKAPRNFTDEELESIFGDFGEIDGVIYDDTRLCSQCRSYEC